MALSPQFLDELRSRTVLSTLIGKSIKVTRAGREWKACCPFHHEKTPSFTINDDKGFYHCFGCSAHGDAIRWMTDQRGLSFIDAVKELADAAGMAIPAPDPRAAERAERALSLRDVTEAAARWYAEQLAGDEGAEARAYLKRRGISPATASAFGIGLAPEGRTRLKAALTQFALPMLIESGMLIQPPDDAPKDRREPYDRFRGRLMIPIRDTRGRVIAFGGRILGAGEPKYLNSPDTPLFDKGRVLFNLDRAAAAARKAERLILVEGYMDVIALAEAGIAEAVAPLGTALTEAQIELAWRHAPVPLLAFDGDSAGQRAALRAAARALPLLRPGHSLDFVMLPAGKDPDDIVRSGGRAAFDALLAQAIPLVDLIWRQSLAEARNDTPEERAGVRARLMAQIDTIADRDVAAHYRAAIRDRLDEAFLARRPRSPALMRKGDRYRGRDNIYAERAPTPALRQVGVSIEQRLGEAIVAGLLRFPDQIAVHTDGLARLPLTDRTVANLLDTLLALAFEGRTGVDTKGLIAILAELPVYPKAMDLLRADTMPFSFTRSSVIGPTPDFADGDAVQMDAEQMMATRRAVRDLATAIEAVVAWPEVDAALAHATEAASVQLDEASFAEQQRLMKAKADLAARIGALMDDASV